MLCHRLLVCCEELWPKYWTGKLLSCLHNPDQDDMPESFVPAEKPLRQHVLIVTIAVSIMALHDRQQH